MRWGQLTQQHQQQGAFSSNPTTSLVQRIDTIRTCRRTNVMLPPHIFLQYSRRLLSRLASSQLPLLQGFQGGDAPLILVPLILVPGWTRMYMVYFLFVVAKESTLVMNLFSRAAVLSLYQAVLRGRGHLRGDLGRIGNERCCRRQGQRGQQKST